MYLSCKFEEFGQLTLLGFKDGKNHGPQSIFSYFVFPN